jgi:prolyl-tRNA synthetase
LEHHHDADGIIWPRSVAPFRYHLLSAGTDEAICRAAEAVYTALGGGDTLYDDLALSAGVKLKDADLLGMPLRITVSARSLSAGGAELRMRVSGETRIVALDDVTGIAEDMLASLSSQSAGA